MIALMELAAARLMQPMLGPGELSVGVSVDVRHTAATPIGGTVRTVATYLAPEGKLFRFRVEAFDDAGPIGEGEHTRAIVATERLLAGAVTSEEPSRPFPAVYLRALTVTAPLQVGLFWSAAARGWGRLVAGLLMVPSALLLGGFVAEVIEKARRGFAVQILPAAT
ncbi:MAG: thioesterase family protein, partial [Thermoanaerobaculia bacterium]